MTAEDISLLIGGDIPSISVEWSDLVLARLTCSRSQRGSLPQATALPAPDPIAQALLVSPRADSVNAAAFDRQLA
jgi:hypothetical protein